jgi:MFS family permease
MLLIIGVASYNFTVVFPLFVEKGLHGTDTQYTLVYAAFSVGGVLGTMVVARRSRVGLRSVIISAGAFGAAMLALSFVPNVTVAYPVVAVLGSTAVAYTTATTAIVQLQPDRRMIGRVIALQTVLQLGTTPVGGPILGFIADAAGGREPVLIGGVAAICASGLGLAATWRQRTRHPPDCGSVGDIKPPSEVPP